MMEKKTFSDMIKLDKILTSSYIFASTVFSSLIKSIKNKTFFFLLTQYLTHTYTLFAVMDR